MQIDEGRNKGVRKDSGQIIKGTLKEAGLKTKASSIPSKIENIVYNNHHRPAFGNSQQRFHTFTASRLQAAPGPGNYNLSLLEARISSKKGYGNFASQTQLTRFNNKRNSNPGPGQYEIPKKIAYNFGGTTIMKSKDTARKLFKDQIQNATQRPSPCDYESGRILRSISAATNIFLSKNERFVQKQPEIPGVGAYHWEAIKNKVKTLKFSNNQKSADKSARSFRQSYFEEIIKTKIDHQSELGPGKYETNLMSTTKTFTFSKEKLQKIKTKLKQKEIEHIQIGNGVKEKSDSFKRLKEQKGGHVSVFKSKTRRYEFGENESQIVGDPRKYSPAINKKQSHLLNFSNKWV